jgi:hypothetical protein
VLVIGRTELVFNENLSSVSISGLDVCTKTSNRHLSADELQTHAEMA